MWRNAQRHRRRSNRHLAVLPRRVPALHRLPLGAGRSGPGDRQGVGPDAGAAAEPELLQQLPGAEGLACGESGPDRVLEGSGWLTGTGQSDYISMVLWNWWLTAVLVLVLFAGRLRPVAEVLSVRRSTTRFLQLRPHGAGLLQVRRLHGRKRPELHLPDRRYSRTQQNPAEPGLKGQFTLNTESTPPLLLMWTKTCPGFFRTSGHLVFWVNFPFNPSPGGGNTCLQLVLVRTRFLMCCSGSQAAAGPTSRSLAT